MWAQGVRPDMKSRRYLEYHGDNLPLRDVMADRALVGPCRTEIGRADAWNAVGVDLVEHGGEIM
jgi:hypothetical protein